MQQEVLVPPGANQQLLHADVPASLLGMGGGDAALTVQDAVAAPVRDELPDVRLVREVGSVVVAEPAVSDPPLGVGVHDAALVVLDGDVLHVPASDEAFCTIFLYFLF